MGSRVLGFVLVVIFFTKFSYSLVVLSFICGLVLGMLAGFLGFSCYIG